MSTVNEGDLQYGPTPPDAQHEHTDIEPSIATRFAVWLTVAMLISVAIVYGTPSQRPVVGKGEAASPRAEDAATE